MNRIDGRVTNLEKNFSRMKAAQRNEKSKYEDAWMKEAIETAMDIRVLLHIEMRASGKPNKEIEERIYNCFLKYGDTGKKPAAEASKPEPAEEKPATEDKPSVGGARAKICDAAKKSSKECEEAAAEEAAEKRRKEREEREKAEEAAKEAERQKREAEQKRREEEKRKQREAEEKKEREEEERRRKEEQRKKDLAEKKAKAEAEKKAREEREAR